KDNQALTILTQLAVGLRLFTSIAVVLSLAYHFARRYDVQQIQAMLLALAAYLSTRTLMPSSPSTSSATLSLPFSIDIWQITIPIATVFLLKALMPFLAVPIDIKNCFTYACKALQHFYAFFVSYAMLLAGWWVLQQIGAVFILHIREISTSISSGALLGLRTLISQLFWFVGLHGNRMANSLLGTSLYTREIFPNLTYGQFYRLFAVSGGSGMGLSLLLALFLGARDEHSRQIARVSTPFVIFNINTLIIYCLPIVFNRFLLIPFVAVPFINLGIAYILLSIVPITFHTASVPWTTPVFVDAWIVGNGNPWLLLLQLFLVLLGTLIYLPFVKKFSHTHLPTYYQDNLTRTLELPKSLRMQQSLNIHKAQYEIIEASLRLEEILGLLTPQTLFVYYQPKIAVATHQCTGVEALLRVRLPDGSLRGPFFLKDIEQAGLSPVLDLWVCHQVKKHLRAWEAQGFTPSSVSINLHPDTINNTEAINKIIQLLQGTPVEFEIIERSLVRGKNAEHNLEKIKRYGFRIAVDDFGQGYSSYRFLSQVNVDTVKTDISLIPLLESDKGQLIWEHMIGLCHRLGLQIVAEGVETSEQVRTLVRLGVDIIQGFFFAEALPMDAIPQFEPPRFPDRA
ncbi:MAG: EAL domain-containing protein, partial [Chloroflexi bacterium]|nr:EAL domain-containing protein [Chloroflexota bacterium]